MTEADQDRPHFMPQNAAERFRLADRPRPGIGGNLIYGLLWAVAGGGTVGVLCFLKWKDVPANDSLSFVGALIGAAGTVAGAAWLANMQQDRERRSEQQIILDAINNLHRQLGSLVAYLSSNSETAEMESERGRHLNRFLSEFYADALRSSQLFQEVMQHARTLSFHQRQTVKALERELSKYLESAIGPAAFETRGQLTLLERLVPYTRDAGRTFSSRLYNRFSGA
ncbi:hypothetical protein P0F65_13625 [Sphingomonas sp. I4]